MREVNNLCSKKDGVPQIGGGIRVCYNIVEYILNKIPICGRLPDSNGRQYGRLSYKLLVDSKTQLKELLDKYRLEIGKLEYKSFRVEQICHTTAYLNKDGSKTKIGEGSDCIAKRC